jgi:plastocyanin
VIEQLWNAILEFTARFVIPDWAAAIALLPIVLLIVIAIWLIWLVRRFATAGPTRRGKGRITPVAPSGLHMPGPSWAPILAAIGAFILFWGLVVGGSALWIGAIVLVVTLLVWGAEALRDYDHVDGSHAELVPAVVHPGPPPGVHMPGPSFRPILASLGVAVLFFGLVFGGWLLFVGLILTIWALLGWLVDARKEYGKVVEADDTGHLENIPAPNYPRRFAWVAAVLIAIALLFDLGIVPPRGQTAAGGEPGASGPPPSAEPGGGGQPPASEEPGPSLPAGDVTIVAQGIAFQTTDVTAPASDFSLVFDNQDNGVPHDVDILGGDGSKVFDSEPFNGPGAEVLEVTGVPAGSYEFICSIHPGMSGTITVQ